ncbi:MAG: TrbG/VirB9 family P-type conjugative transfer protein [Gammaproteobacteria bacterium]|nr:TrbG/VirB9 family P-type conjugative transfer protein [Gammaproteobacteria bacterium]
MTRLNLLLPDKPDRIIGLAMLCAVFTMHAAAAGESCRIVEHEPHKFVRIKSRLHHGTHIELPELLVARPVTGNRDLWDVEGDNRHIFVKPNDADTSEGGSTTVTAVSRSNRSYHFLVERSTDEFDLCVVITHDGEFLPQGSFSGFAQHADQQRTLYQQQLDTLQLRLDEEQQAGAEQLSAALDEYRMQLFTGYEWQGGRAPYSADLISDVYDDGRFTYIRVRHNLAGAMSLFADNNGQEQFIDYRYDADKRIYVVTGVFTRIHMKADEKTRIIITRQGAAHG